VTLGADSLFCFALVQPAGYEIDMIRWLHEQRKSLFLCDRYAIYSNQTLSLGGLKNLVVETSLEAPIGGEWNTALNTPIFQKLWMQVIHDRQYKEAGWTVKVDVDAVFLPSRLRELVGGDDYKDAQEGQGHFLNNCEVKGSLHGPIEVLSRKALEVYGKGYTGCDQSWQQEDVFMRMCLVSMGVTQHYDWVVMSEQYCNDDWESCSTNHITFHPFKSVDSYQACLSQAEGEGQSNRACVGPGKDCREAGCCTEAGQTCYQKSEGWASCKPTGTCVPGPDPEDENDDPWSCDEVSRRL
jgi:hypothetical protein